MSLKGWKDQLLKNSIQPIQQFAYTQGKNATDAAMVIDAMDLLYSNRFDGFCLISSDSDFTRLASRIRESALVVYGCGERKTPQPFVTACDKFIYIENLAPKIESPKSIGISSPKPITTGYGNIPSHVAAWIIEAVEATSDEGGWAGLANVGHLIVKRYPDFDPRTYGFTKLNELITATSMFEIDRRIPGEGKPSVVYLRDKKRSSRHNVAW